MTEFTLNLFSCSRYCKQAQELNQMSDQPRLAKNDTTKVSVSKETEVKKLGFKVKSTLV